MKKYIKYTLIAIIAFFLFIHLYSKGVKPNKIDSSSKSSDIKILNNTQFYNKSIELNKQADNLADRNADSSIILINQSISISEEYKFHELLANAYLIKSRVLRQKGDFENALKLAENSIKIYEENNLQKGKSKAYSYLGFTYFRKSDYPKALKYFDKALTLDIELNDSSKIALDNTQIGLVYGRESQFEKSLEYHKKALEIAEKIKDSSLIYDIHSNLGIGYLKMKDYDNALNSQNKVLEKALKENNKNLAATTYGNIGNIYYELKDFNKAKEYHEKSLEIFKILKYKNSSAVSYLNLGQSKLKLSNNLKENIDSTLKKKLEIEAYDDITLSLKIFRDINNLDAQKYALLGLCEYYEAVGDFKKAYYTHKEAKLLNDSIFSKENLIKIAELETKRTLELKEKEYLLLQKESQLKSIDLIRKNQQIELFKSKEEIYTYELKQKNDSLILIDKEKELKDLQIKKGNIETESFKKDILNLAKLKAEEENSKNAIAFALFLALVLLIVIFIFLRRKSKHNLILNEKNKLIENANAELLSQNLIIQEQNIEMETLNANLMEREKELIISNNSKDKFLSIIAHDIKNPLHSTLMTSEILKHYRNKMLDSEINTHLNTIHKTAENLSNLLDSLLQWARAQSGKIEFQPEHFNLYDLAEQSIELLKNSASKKEITIENLIDNSHMIYADKNMISTIIRNIISNSIKFTSNGIIKVNAKIEDGKTTVFVEDTGIGMDKSSLANLFKLDVTMTTRGTNNERGTGLGLHLCKEFVEYHNGKIWAQSQIGKGSTFYFTINI